MTAAAIQIGLAAWAFAAWRGPYFPLERPPLESYAKVFATVEGNITFYTLPDAPTVARWCEILRSRKFSFCFKLPRQVTHGGLARERALLSTLFKRLEPLGEHVGPFMIQLPPRIGRAELGDVEALLQALPREHAYALEFRNLALMRAPEPMFDLLQRYECGRVLLDSRPIYGDAPAHPDLEAAEREKPDLPVLWQGPETLRIVRFVGHPLLAHSRPFVAQWAEHLQGWLQPGRQLHFMVHCPNDIHSPGLARAIHVEFRAGLHTSNGAAAIVAPMPAWPVAQLGLDF